MRTRAKATIQSARRAFENGLAMARVSLRSWVVRIFRIFLEEFNKVFMKRALSYD